MGLNFQFGKRSISGELLPTAVTIDSDNIVNIFKAQRNLSVLLIRVCLAYLNITKYMHA